MITSPPHSGESVACVENIVNFRTPVTSSVLMSLVYFCLRVLRRTQGHKECFNAQDASLGARLARRAERQGQQPFRRAPNP